MSTDPVDYDKAFADLVDEVALKKREFNAPLVVGHSSEFLLSFGRKPLPVVIPGSVINKAREKHGISIENIKTLPKQLREPMAIFTSDTQPNSINVLTDFRNRDGKSVSIAIHLEAPIVWGRAHKVATISERNESQIEIWRGKGLMRYNRLGKQKAPVPITGLQLPGEEPAPEENVSQITGNVNSPSERLGEKLAASQEKQKARTQYAGLQLPGEGSTPGKSIAQRTVPSAADLLTPARLETESRLSAREDFSPEAKARVWKFLGSEEGGKIWKSQTLDPDGRIAAAAVLGGLATFEDATKALPELQHGVVRALARAHARGQERGPQISL